MDHVPGTAGGDLAGLAVVLAVRVDEAALVQSGCRKVACGCSAGDDDAVGGELMGDAGSRPLVSTSHLFDPADHLVRGGCRLTVRRRGTVQETEIAVAAVAVDPLRGACPRDAHLGGDVSDRSGATTVDEPAEAFNGQGCVGVCHGWLSVVFVRMTDGVVVRATRRVVAVRRPSVQIAAAIRNGRAAVALLWC